MIMSYSSLTNYRCFTGNKSNGRGGNKVIKIAVHHMAGNLSVEQCGKVFVNNRVSAHYGVNGSRIGCYVDESNTAWALGNFAWNQKSINIECANDGGASTGWHVSDATIETCINLIVDIAYRLGWTYVAYDGTWSGSDIVMHKQIASTACPGPYLSSKMKYIAAEADKRLKAKRGSKPSTTKLTVDGKWGTATSKAFQKYLGVKQDGIFGVKSVKAMQKWLGVKQDGIMGPKTIKALQKKLGVTQDGICGPKTVKALQTFLNNR